MNNKCEISVSIRDGFYSLITSDKRLLEDLAYVYGPPKALVENYVLPLQKQYVLDMIMSARNANAFWECLAYSPALKMSILKHAWSIAVVDGLVQIRVGLQKHGSLQFIERDIGYLFPAG